MAVVVWACAVEVVVVQSVSNTALQYYGCPEGRGRILPSCPPHVTSTLVAGSSKVQKPTYGRVKVLYVMEVPLVMIKAWTGRNSASPAPRTKSSEPWQGLFATRPHKPCVLLQFRDPEEKGGRKGKGEHRNRKESESNGRPIAQGAGGAR